ncbi:MAG: hypothetical protein LW850_25610 [Planctomycetaceae bacterium]|jgi:hypothetical protein|nr:hypothetical protein [Planctomycetaceae bacterium]
MLIYQLPAKIGVGPWIGFALRLSLVIASLWASLAHAQNLDSARLLPVGGQRGSSVTIELPGKFEKWPISFWAQPNQVQWSASETPGKIVANIPADANIGLHWVRLHSPESISPLMRFFVSEYLSVLEIEPNDAFAKPQVIEALPAEIHGILQKSGDVDHYQIKLSKGQRLVASLEANRRLKSPMDACLEIVDQRGNVFAQNLDALGLDPRLVFIAPGDGLFSVRVYAFPEAPDSTIGYAGGDKYLYRLQCLSGDVDDLATGFQSDALAISEPSQREMPTVVTLVENQNRYAFYGALETPKDEDVLQIETKEAGFWKITAMAESLGSPLDAVIEVLSADNKSLGKQGESGEIKDPVLASQMKAPGVYRIAIRDLHGRFGAAFRYRLELENEFPVVLGTIANDVIQGKSDKPTEIEVTLERTHGCAQEATVAIQGLGPEYTCEPVVSKMKEESEKKVVLKVTAVPKADGSPQVGWSGPVSIEIQTQGQAASKQANATNTKEPHLWLRIAP